MVGGTMKADSRLLLGIDLGTSSVKVLLTTTDGPAAGRGTAEYDILIPGPGRAEQEPEAWWGAVRAAVARALAGSDPRQIAAIGLSGQMHGTVLLDEGGLPLARAIIWPDQRSGRQVDVLTGMIGRERLLQIIGGPLATGFMAPTVRWIRDERPELWARVRYAVLPKDYLRLRLTGELASEPSDGSGTALLDERRRDWSDEVLAAVGLTRDHLPPLRESASLAGTLLPPAAADLGLPPGIPVVTGAADTPCGMLGAGVVAPDAFLMTLSTGGQLAVPAAEVRVDPLGRTHTFCSALAPGGASAGWYQMGAILSAGLALRWLRDSILAVEGPDAYDRMTAWAAEAEPGAGGLVFLPYLVGERTPHMDPLARGVLLGLTSRHGRPEIVRAVLEGITLACLDAHRALGESGVRPSRMVLAGGGARSPLWQQMVADIFGLPVCRLETDEQAAVGAVLLAGAGIGAFDPAETARTWARYGPLVEPDAARHERYGEVGAIFRDAYRHLRDDFPRLHAIDDAAAGDGTPTAS